MGSNPILSVFHTIPENGDFPCKINIFGGFVLPKSNTRFDKSNAIFDKLVATNVATF